MSELSLTQGHNQLNHIAAEQLGVARDAEVITRSVDMVPERSALGDYLSQPAVDMVRGEDGHARFEPNGLSQLDELKNGLSSAVEATEAGNVGRVGLMHGMINGSYETGRPEDGTNLRLAFDMLSHFNITGGSDFHQLFRASGADGGQLQMETPAAGVSEANAKAFAAAGAALRDGKSSAVMFKDEQGQYDSKMLAIRDPQTGELLRNSFMRVWSGIYKDKDGTASNFSNLAAAEILTIPDQLLDEASQPAAQTEEAFNDIDNVEWSLFKNPNFKVLRSSGDMDQGGWRLVGTRETEDGKALALITSDTDRGVAHKTVLLEDLIKWQKSEN